MQMNKKDLRKVLLMQREALACKEIWDGQIAQHVIDSAAFTRAHTVFLYVSMPIEVDTRAILRAAWKAGKTVAVPRCSENHTMRFHRIESEDDLCIGSFGIAEPKMLCPAVTPRPQDLCIVPALAVDGTGTRLGFGGGYYDRFLARVPVYTMALCYQLYSILPQEEWDVPMCSAVTPSGVITFKKESLKEV